MSVAFSLDRLYRVVDETNPIRTNGKVTRVVGLVIEGLGPGASVGELCNVYPKGKGEPVLCEVIGFTEGKILLMPLGEIKGLGPGSKIVSVGGSATVKVGRNLLGRVVDGLGNPIDGKGSLNLDHENPLYAMPLNPLKRARITEPLDVGVNAINGLLTCGRGQRLGIFAGSGVGKSVLLGMMARNTEADVNVIALIGERGREVKEFIEKDLKEEGLKRSVVIAATSDQPPLVRLRGAYTATAIAEYFRDKGEQVLFMMDSLTRFAMAQREVGLSIGEPPTTKGYPPSVFASIPKLLERAGTCSGEGAITGFYTVLVEGDDINEPIADATRAVLDGHIVLSREMASHGHYPAIDVLGSTSRVMIDVVEQKHKEYAQRLKSVMATYRRSYDLISIGAYKQGSDPQVDNAVKMIDRINGYLKQDIDEKVTYADSIERLYSMF
ncbi:MAG: flagellar protein export ATPase FliI [Deltaproteobacteria bacterium]|nr:flagellar protein export ATPase FliI [Deltaproteobacteria bacterium]